MKIKREKKIIGTVAVSNRHIHLTKETYEKLFDEPLAIKRPLNQIGEYASNQTATIKTAEGQIENVRIIGPFRKYNQVEISRSDARMLGINPPVRESGDLEESENITIIGKKGELYLESCCIQAERHVHLNNSRAFELGLQDNDIVKVKVNTDKSGIMDAFVKISSNGYFEIHIDTDDANAFMLNTGDEVEIEKYK